MDLVMNNLKTKDLPKIIKIVKKLKLQAFLKEGIKEVFLEDIDTKELKDFENKSDEEKKELLENVKDETVMTLIVSFAERLIENYDEAYDEINNFIGGLYNLKKNEVEELDLDVFMDCIYNLRKQDKIINFLKTALK